MDAAADIEGDLLARWKGTAARAGADTGRAEAAGGDILTRYREPHRRYHTALHLSEMLGALDANADLAPDPVRVELAVWFHDAVYDPHAGAGANEEASASYASGLLGELGVDDVVRADVARLVRATADHTVAAGDANGAVLIDADLWILAAPSSRYRQYAAQVREEYGWLPEPAWREGRSAVLRDFLARPRIYATARAHASFDGAARRNLRAELSALGGSEAQA